MENVQDRKIVNVMEVTVAPNLETKLYPIRYAHILIIAFGSLLSAVTYSQYAIVANVITEYYGVSFITVEWTSMACLLGMVLPSYPTIMIFEKKGLKTTFVIGLIGLALGMWIQGVGSHIGLFWLILLGQCVLSLVQCCFINLTPQFVSYWFKTDQLATACAVVLFFNYFGTGLSCILAPALLNHYSYLSIGLKLTYLNYGLATVTTLLAILTIFVFEGKPSLPPSEAQAKIWNKKPDGYEPSTSTKLWLDAKELVKNKNFIIHLISASIVVSFAWYYLIILNQLLIIKYPKNNNDIAAIGLLNNFMGVLGIIVFGLIVDKTRKYRETIIGLNFCVFLSVCFFVGSIYVNITTVYVSSSLLGLFAAAYLNLALEMSSEISYPVSEVVSSSMIMFFGCLFGIIMTYVSNWMLENCSYIVALIFIIVYSFLGSLTSVFVKSDLRRMAASEKTKDLN